MTTKIDVLGVKISSTTMDEVLEKIRFKIQDSRSKAERPLFVATVNPEFVLEAQDNEEFRDILNRVDIAIADGRGLRLAAGFPEIIPGRILVERLLQNDYRTFFLGGVGHVALDLASKYNGLGDMGEKDIRKGEQESVRIVSKINKYKPDVLLVAYGAPWQELWIAKHLDKLGARVVVGVGGTFNYLAGKSKVPPRMVSKLGFEWLWRLVHEPKRFKRQLKLVKYIYLVLRQKIHG